MSETIAAFAGKRIVLGVSGSIAAYKAAWVASRLTQAGARVDTVLTRAATKFITPLTFQSLTGRPALTAVDLWAAEGHVLHVGLGEGADLLIVAPATATTIARLAMGLGDDLLGLVALSARCPVLVAPAMDGGMYSHPSTSTNVETLRSRGVSILGPATGRMASGLVGPGRMVEPDLIVGQARRLLSEHGPLTGRRVLVTAGPTREPLDPVRFLSNRSTGKQGFALAQAALDQGADVVLVAGPTNLPTPQGALRVDVTTAAEMSQAVLTRLYATDVLLMSAAVADFRPARVEVDKIKKHADGVLGSGESLALPLAPNEDILARVAEVGADKKVPRVVVGFAAESANLLDNAADKLARKRLSFIVANDISRADAGFGIDQNIVTLIHDDGRRESLPAMSKARVAETVLAEVVARMADAAVTSPG